MPAQSYTNTFGGQTINPVLLSYIAYSIDADLELVWPIEAPPDANVAADKVDVTASDANLGVTVPPGNQTSVGADILFRNPGVETFYVYDQDGVEIGQVASGEAWYFVLIDNSTDAGIWYAVEFGAGTSSATAASLAGAGLRANMSLLDQNLVTNALLGSYAVGISDRATVLQNGGGAVVYTFTSAATLGNGWFVYVINAGSGSLVLTPAGGQTIDGSATKTLAPTENAIVFSDGSNLHTLGYGRSLVNTVTGTSINIAGTGTYSLSSPEIAAQIQDWSGTLTGNRTLDYGGGVGYWFVWNNTTGAYSATARVNGIDAGVAVSQGSFSILRSNGTTMSIAFTATSGTVTSVATTSNLTGGPITTTGTLDLSNTGVTAGTYGTASQVPVLAIDGKGRTTSGSNLPIAITGSQVTDLNTIIAAALAAYLPTGSVQSYVGSSAPSGWVLGFGTIGNAASAATNRANADTVNLFTLIWNSFADAQAPVSGGRGANAAADYAANKNIAVPDLRGRVVAGLDNMGGSAAGRLTSTTMSPDGITMGATGGAQTETAAVTGTATVTGTTAGSLAVNITSGAPSATVSWGTGGGSSESGGTSTHTHNVSGSATGSLTVAATGTISGTTAAATNVQPALLLNIIIRL